jgi:radical SAM protein with 4Fe4S-binding SPASM domain
MNRPFSLFNIELTNRCVMKCVMCPRTYDMKRPVGDIDLLVYKKAIDELARCNPAFGLNEVLWLHHFGESLLHPDFGECIRYAAGKNIRTGLSVNPIMLTGPVIDELIFSAPHVLYISLDGHDEASFASIRGVHGAFKHSTERLMAFLIKKIGTGAAIEVVLSMIDFNLNRESIARSRGHWESVPGIDRFLAKNFTTWDGSTAGINYLQDKQPSADTSSVRCSWPWNRMSMTWDGDVVPCCFDHDKKYVLGTIKNMSLAEIWNGEMMEALRSEFTANTVRNPLCVNCERLYAPEESIRP